MNLKRRPYVPDLTQQMALAAANYHRLQRLLGDQDSAAAGPWVFAAPGAAEQQLRARRLEAFAYTSTWQLQLAGGWWQQPLVVRLYHDAGLAEVVQSPGFGQLQGSYPAANPRGYSRDEKAQQNHFLAQLLRQVLQHGLAPASAPQLCEAAG